MSKVRNAAVYLMSANWDKVTAWIGAGAAGVSSGVIPPWLLTLLGPALAWHWVQALFAGRQALAEAQHEAWVKNRIDTLAAAAKDIPKADE